MEPGRALVRSRDRLVAGVISGLARYLGWPVGRTRVAYVVLSVVSGGFPGILVYLLLWVVMPDRGRAPRALRLETPAARDHIPPE